MAFVCFLEHMDFTNFAFYDDWSGVEKWVELHGIKAHRSAVLAGKPIHEAPDGRRAFIIEGHLRGLTQPKPVKLLEDPGPFVNSEPWDLDNL
jgi:hypothetical protein